MYMWSDLISLIVEECSVMDLVNNKNLLTELFQISPCGSTALHFAALNESISVACLLIQLGLDVNCSNFTQQTPLHWAARQGSVKMVRFLLEQGAQILPDDLGNLPIHYGAERDDDESLQIINVLLKARFPSLRDRNQADQTPLDVAMFYSNYDNMQELLSSYKEPTTIFKAIDLEDIGLLSCLLAARVDSMTPSEAYYNFTPLEYATKMDLPDLVALLTRHNNIVGKPVSLRHSSPKLRKEVKSLSPKLKRIVQRSVQSLLRT